VNITGRSYSSTAVVVESDGKVIVASTFGLVRLTAQGQLDESFGTGGTVSTDSGTILRLSLSASGQIVALGYSNGEFSNGPADFVVARYSSAGQPDVHFGQAGELTIPAAAAGAQSYGLPAYSIAGNQTIFANTYGAGASLIDIERDGTLDSSFGDDGTLNLTTPGDTAPPWQGFVIADRTHLYHVQAMNVGPVVTQYVEISAYRMTNLSRD